jgi:quinol monooxygenase YgiN
MTYVRIFNSAVDPSEVDLVRKAFEEELRPAFRNVEGCESLELLIGAEPNAGGLVEGCILARWRSPDDIEQAYTRHDVRQSANKIRSLLRQEPVIRLYEILE